MNSKFLQGENIFFRPYHPDDAALFCEWFNGIGLSPLTLGRVKDFIDQQMQSDHNVVLVAVESKNNKPIGLMGLCEIDCIVRKAELKIIFSSKNFWEERRGNEAIELITFFGFDRLNLNRIYLDYTVDNKRADEPYKKAGFVYEGTLREHINRSGRYYDVARMAILRRDYEKKLYQSHLKRFK